MKSRTRPAATPGRLLDRVGAVWAGLCAVHCLALPLVFVAVPALAASLYSFHARHHALAITLLRVAGWEPWFIGISSLVTGIAVGRGWRWHRSAVPGVLALAGIGSLALAWFVAPALGGWLHVAGIACGGSLLVATHACNLRLLRRLVVPA